MYAAILLAAGSSQRMGRPKGLLDWKGKPLIQHQIDEIQRSEIDDVIVVLGHHAECYIPLIPKNANIKVLINDNWQQGKSSSIGKGLTGLATGHRAVLFVNIDQPLCHLTVDQLIRSFERRESIQIPVYGGIKGHPIMLSTRLMEAMQGITEETFGLKAVIRANSHLIDYVPVVDSTVLYNFNTRDDYEGRRKD